MCFNFPHASSNIGHVGVKTQFYGLTFYLITTELPSSHGVACRREEGRRQPELARKTHDVHVYFIPSYLGSCRRTWY